MASLSGGLSGEASRDAGRRTPSAGVRHGELGHCGEVPRQTRAARCALCPHSELDWTRLDDLLAMGRRALLAPSLEAGWSVILDHAVEAARADAGILCLVTPAGEGRLVASQGFGARSGAVDALSRRPLSLDVDLSAWARTELDLPSETRCFESTLIGRDGPCGVLALFWLKACADEARAPDRDPFLTRVAEAAAQSLDTLRLGQSREQAQKELKQAQSSCEQAQKELKQAQNNCEQVRREVAAARRRDLSRRAFLGAIAHELNTALNAFSGSLRLRDELGTDSAEHGARARRVVDLAIQRLTRLIGDLSDLSRLGIDRFPLRRSRLDVRAILIPALDACARELTGSDVSLIADLGDEPLLIEADGERLAQIVDNLLLNARRHTERGFIEVRAWREASGEIALRVRDSGAGLDKAQLAALFESFWSDRARWHSHHGGMGLGLCLSRELVARLGGRMWARSDGPGQGSAFELRFLAL